MAGRLCVCVCVRALVLVAGVAPAQHPPPSGSGIAEAAVEVVAHPLARLSVAAGGNIVDPFLQELTENLPVPCERRFVDTCLDFPCRLFRT